jgi:hypothetical protein
MKYFCFLAQPVRGGSMPSGRDAARRDIPRGQGCLFLGGFGQAETGLPDSCNAACMSGEAPAAPI